MSLCTSWRHMASRGTAPLILNLSTRRSWVVNFMPWPLYPHYAINRVCGNHSQFRHLGRWGWGETAKSSPCHKSNHDSSLVQVVDLSLYYAIPAPMTNGLPKIRSLILKTQTSTVDKNCISVEMCITHTSTIVLLFNYCSQWSVPAL